MNTMKKIYYPPATEIHPFLKKQREMGWATIEDLFNNTDIEKLVCSKETYRKFIVKDILPNPPIFIGIAYMVGFTPKEIKELLIRFNYDTFFTKIIGNTEALDTCEEAIVDLFRKIRKKNPHAARALINVFDSLCCSMNVNCQKEIDVLKKRIK